MPTADDPELLGRLRSGAPGAWNEVVDRYGRLVYSIPFNFGLNAEDAADIAQITFRELVSQVDRIRDDDRLGAWLATVARRQTWRRATANRTQISTDDVPDQVVLDDANERVDLLLWLDAGLSRLDAKCRTLIETLYLHGDEPSYAEVSTQLSMPVGSIGPTRQRCLDRLRGLMQELDD